MSSTLQLYTCATWVVKPGREVDFIAAWQAFADWTTGSQAGAGAGILLQNQDEPNKFFSYGPWATMQNIKDWRAKPQFLDFIKRARQLCEEFQPQTMHVVASSNPEGS